MFDDVCYAIEIEYFIEICALVFQANDAGSIPAARSSLRKIASKKTFRSQSSGLSLTLRRAEVM